MIFTLGSLFAGIEGFGLGLERAGFRCKWQVEIDPYARRILEKHWPDVPKWDDVRTFPPDGDWGVDVIAGGFPCQGLSAANARGTGLDDSRSGLWVEFIRIVRELRPTCVIMENVPTLTRRGLGRILGELAEIGFDAEWDCIPSSLFGRDHRRERLFILAYPSAFGWEEVVRREEAVCDEESFGWTPRNVDTQTRQAERLSELESILGEPCILGVNYGIPHRVERLGCLGNAVDPKAAEWIGRKVLTVLTHNRERSVSDGK